MSGTSSDMFYPPVLLSYSFIVAIVSFHSFLHSYPYIVLFTYIHLLEYELLSVVSITPTENIFIYDRLWALPAPEYLS